MTVPVQRAPVTAVVPVKPVERGKSRLALPPAQRAALAEAFAADVVAALLACPPVAEVLVVTADAAAGRRLRALGARLVEDSGTGLREAVRAGSAAARPGRRLAVVPADLPFLTSDALGALLQEHATGFVPDRGGTGTTVLLPPPGAVEPRYGPGSAVAHAALGLPRLEGVASCLRHDVDVLEDLHPAPGERWGPATRELLRRLPVPERQAG